MKKSYREMLEIAKKKLQASGIPEYELDAWYILEKVFNISKVRYYMDCDLEQEIDNILYQQFLEITAKRSRRIPLQYITGMQEFMGLNFYVNENVLIPRQDTEILVETIMADIQKYNFRGDELFNNAAGFQTNNIIEKTESISKNSSGVIAENILSVQKNNTNNNVSENISIKKIDILDMCTGSGCIAISLAKLCDNTEVYGVDISKAALEVASKNNKSLDTKVTFLESNLFSNVQLNNKKFDIIVSNPPYIRTDVIQTLMAEVKDYEPMIALDGKSDGLYFYQKIIKEAKNYLKPNGRIYFEIGYDQGRQVSELLLQNGYQQIEIIKDLAGLDRVVKA